MLALPWHPSRGPAASRADAFDFPYDDLLINPADAPISGRRADCCVAPAAYRAVLPVTASRPRITELLLCSHHFHSTRAGLTRAGASVYDASNHLIDSAEHSCLPHQHG